jgi:hypothetical protein
MLTPTEHSQPLASSSDPQLTPARLSHPDCPLESQRHHSRFPASAVSIHFEVNVSDLNIQSKWADTED